MDIVDQLYARLEAVNREDDMHIAIDNLLDVLGVDEDWRDDERIAILTTLAHIDVPRVDRPQPEPGTVFVSQYEVTRHYGGPEEGGWYYDRHRMVAVVTKIRENEALTSARNTATAIRRSLNRLARRQRIEDRRPQGRFSVHGGADVEYRIERTPGEDDDTNQPRPHYC